MCRNCELCMFGLTEMQRGIGGALVVDCSS